MHRLQRLDWSFSGTAEVAVGLMLLATIVVMIFN